MNECMQLLNGSRDLTGEGAVSSNRRVKVLCFALRNSLLSGFFGRRNYPRALVDLAGSACMHLAPAGCDRRGRGQWVTILMG
jgi:hypothetical protein